MGRIESWQHVWGALTRRRRVSAMDRRGRGSSGDAGSYELSSEYADVAAVAAALADEQDGPVDVVGHSIGATCVLGAAALGAPFRRIVLYEPPGPQATQNNWPERVAALVADGQAGRAVFTFLTEIIGLTRGEVETLRDAPGGRDVLPIAAATLPREARALAAADLAGAACHVTPRGVNTGKKLRKKVPTFGLSRFVPTPVWKAARWPAPGAPGTAVACSPLPLRCLLRQISCEPRNTRYAAPAPRTARYPI